MSKGWHTSMKIDYNILSEPSCMGTSKAWKEQQRFRTRCTALLDIQLDRNAPFPAYGIWKEVHYYSVANVLTMQRVDGAPP